MACSQSAQEVEGGTYEDVDVARFAELIAEGNGLLLDVRTPGECEAGMIEGATNIDYNGPDFTAQIEALDRDTPVLVYCASGGRSGNTMDMMAELGFVEVYNLDGGYTAWSAERE